MTDIQKQIVALNRYARQPDFFCENWGTAKFKRTFAAAVAACSSDGLVTTLGVEVSWSDHRPEQLDVTKSHIFRDGLDFHKSLPLEGAVADALLHDLQDLAALQARQDILEERERALKAQAEERVRQLMARAVSATEGVAA